jgi:hypothetical protein
MLKLSGHWIRFINCPREQIRDRVLAILNTPGLEVAESDLLIEAITH